MERLYHIYVISCRGATGWKEVAMGIEHRSGRKSVISVVWRTELQG